MAVVWKKVIEDKKADRTALDARMDTDRKLVELAKYKFEDVNGNEIPDSVAVTLNDMAVFATNVESALGNASEQGTVVTDDKNFDTAEVEGLLRAAFAAANARLMMQRKWPLNPYIDQQMCRRGQSHIVSRFRLDKNKVLIPDMAEWDSRYVYGKEGLDGWEWICYETTRRIEQIRLLYPKADITGEDSTEVKVWDIYDKKINYIFANDIEVFQQPHPFGKVPVASQLVPMGSMTADKGNLEFQAESIFFLIRGLVPELNRLVSIIQNLNIRAFDNALLWKTKDGAEATKEQVPEYKDLTKPANVTAADIGGGADPIAIGQLQRHAYLLHQMIETRIQRGSLSAIDYGTLNFQLSAVALVEIGEGRDQVFLPRLGARGLLKQQLAEMIIEQILLTGAKSVEIGTRGHKRSFDVSKIIGEYEIVYKYFIKSPKIDIARYSMAAAAGNLVSDKFKVENILQMEDPEGDKIQRRWEEAERLSPGIKMNRTIMALLEMAKKGDKRAEFEAEVMSVEMGVNLQQMRAGEITQQPKPEKEEKPQPMVPMFGRGGGSAKKAAELQGTPRAEGGGE